MASVRIVCGSQRWLERTPGLERTPDGFDFWQQYKEKAEQYLDDEVPLPLLCLPLPLPLLSRVPLIR